MICFQSVVIRDITAKIRRHKWAAMTREIREVHRVHPMISGAALVRTFEVLLPRISIAPIKRAYPTVMVDEFVIEAASIFMVSELWQS